MTNKEHADLIIQARDDLRFLIEDLRKGRDVELLEILDRVSDTLLLLGVTEADEGIRVGIYDTKKTTITWYWAHSLTRQRGGALTVFALNDDRTPVTVPAARFAGVCNSIIGEKDILELKL